MIRPDYRTFQYSNELYHYGMPRRSGRYPWGSGRNPYQSEPVHKRFIKSVKSQYERLPRPVKTSVKIGIDVAESVLLSQALGVVGGTVAGVIINRTLKKDSNQNDGEQQIKPNEKDTYNKSLKERPKQIDEEYPTELNDQDLSNITYSELTESIASGPIGDIIINQQKQ